MTDWKKAESTVRPEIIDDTSSQKVVYQRRNIREVERVNSNNENDNETTTYYEFEERVFTKEEYSIYLIEQEQRNLREEDIIDAYTLQLMEEGVL